MLFSYPRCRGPTEVWEIAGTQSRFRPPIVGAAADAVHVGGGVAVPSARVLYVADQPEPGPAAQRVRSDTEQTRGIFGLEPFVVLVHGRHHRGRNGRIKANTCNPWNDA